MTEPFRRWGLLAALPLILLAGAGAAAAYVQTGLYGVNVLWQRGGGVWVPVPPDSPRLSPSMRLALQDPPPALPPRPGEWRAAAAGVAVGQLMLDDPAISSLDINPMLLTGAGEGCIALDAVVIRTV